MKKQRLIPILLLRNGWLVQSKNFREYKNLGNPVTAVKRLSEWAADELIYLDISKNENYDRRREENKYPNRSTLDDIIKDVSKTTFMPLTVGGKINTLNDIEKRLYLGADKITFNSKAIEESEFITKSSKEFGAQCIVVSVDVKIEDGNYKVYSHKKNKSLEIDAKEFIMQCQDRGAGEILLNSVDRDGKGNGYDIEMISDITKDILIPVIICGGVSEWDHFADGLKKTNADAVAAANIFHYKDQSVFLAKKYLYEKSYNVRKPTIININNL